MQKSQRRNKHRKKNGMSRPKITNSIAMIPNESDTEDLPDKEFKGMVINRFKQLKDVSILQEHRNKQLNQIKKSIQNMKIEFNKKIEFLKQSHKEMMETTAYISRIRSSTGSLPNRINRSCGEENFRA